MTYASTVLADSPIRYYRLNESSGTVATDAGSQAQNGTLHGTITLSQPGLLVNDSDTAMLPNGSTGYISLPTTSLPSGASAFTLECWCKWSSLPGTQVLVEIGTASTQKAAALFTDAHLLKAGFEGNNDLVWGVGMSAGVAYHLTLTYDGTTAIFYVQGVSRVTNTPTLNITYGNASIGQDVGTGLFLSGVIDEVAIYNSALSAARVLAHYQAGAVKLSIHDGSYGGVFS